MLLTSYVDASPSFSSLYGNLCIFRFHSNAGFGFQSFLCKFLFSTLNVTFDRPETFRKLQLPLRGSYERHVCNACKLSLTLKFVLGVLILRSRTSCQSLLEHHTKFPRVKAGSAFDEASFQVLQETTDLPHLGLYFQTCNLQQY